MQTSGRNQTFIPSRPDGEVSLSVLAHSVHHFDDEPYVQDPVPSQNIHFSVIRQKLEIIVLYSVPPVYDIGHLMRLPVHNEGHGSFIGLIARIGKHLCAYGQVLSFHGRSSMETGVLSQSQTLLK
jgi:hypothetical protein